ncbi:hypothetical protein [Streptomyces sp. NPDC047968]|uniref:hypothetical protein n=1 Tax=unclassified Streptomyces TaxID=2593676 RepID=UPI003423E76E
MKLIEQLKLDKNHLGRERKTASPAEKRLITKQMKLLDGKIRQASEELRHCRMSNPAPKRPDIAIGLDRCLPESVRVGVEAAVTDAFEKENGISQAGCFGEEERIGIWLPVRGESGGRELGLEAVSPPRKPGEVFGVTVSAGLIRGKVRSEWSGRPKAYSDKGEPNESGPIFLTGLTFRMEEPNVVVTEIEGFRRGFVDTDFTVKTTDFVEIDSGKPSCVSSTDIDVDFDILSFLLELGTAGLYGIARGLFRIGAQWKVAASETGDVGGVGCALLDLLCIELELPNGGTFGLAYQRIEVTSAGHVLAGGRVSGL